MGVDDCTCEKNGRDSQFTDYVSVFYLGSFRSVFFETTINGE